MDCGCLWLFVVVVYGNVNPLEHQHRVAVIKKTTRDTRNSKTYTISTTMQTSFGPHSAITSAFAQPTMKSFVAVGVLVVLCVCVHAQGQRHDVAPVGERRPVIDDVKRLHESVHAQLDTPVRDNINYSYCMTRGCCGLPQCLPSTCLPTPITQAMQALRSQMEEVQDATRQQLQQAKVDRQDFDQAYLYTTTMPGFRPEEIQVLRYHPQSQAGHSLHIV